MRTIGVILMTVGLIVALVALAFVELGSAATSDRAQSWLYVAFSAGGAMCLIGAVMFTVRVVLARRARARRG